MAICRYLAIDYSVECGSERYNNMAVYAYIMIAVYPIGVPLFFFVLLWRNRYNLNPRPDVKISVAIPTDRDEEAKESAGKKSKIQVSWS